MFILSTSRHSRKPTFGLYSSARKLVLCESDPTTKLTQRRQRIRPLHYQIEPNFSPISRLMYPKWELQATNSLCLDLQESGPN